MQTWAKRSMQAALVTGGMMMLGAGIASAAETCPDRPATPLGGSTNPLGVSVDVPLDFEDNAVGTPFGQWDAPEFHERLSTDDLYNKAVPAELNAPLTQALAPVRDAMSPVSHGLQQYGGHHFQGDPALGNRAELNVLAPIEASGNALALGGPVHVEHDGHHDYHRDSALSTNGDGSLIGGNAAAINYVAPIQANGNALGLGGDASSVNNSSTDASIDGSTRTSGDGSLAGGNVLGLPLSTPITGNGNAFGVLGDAWTKNNSSVNGSVTGNSATSGEHGVLGGNYAGVPLGLPIAGNGNAFGVLGNGDAHSKSHESASVGGAVHSNGEHGLGSGNVSQTPIAGPLGLNGNATSALGGSSVKGGDASCTDAGYGDQSSSGQHSILGGNHNSNPIALPVLGFGNATAVGGDADADYNNAVSSHAGSNVYGDGNDSLLGGSVLSTPLAGPYDAFGNATSALGNANSTSHNDAEVTAGNTVDTRGWGSQLGGNVGSVPISAPLQAFGNGTGALGDANAKSVNNKVSQAGGYTSCEDDAGLGACNVAAVPVSLPGEVYGNGTGVGGNGSGEANSHTSANAGGETVATGKGGTGAGNVAFVPVAGALQAIGNSTSAIGNSHAGGHGHTGANAGGDVRSDGSDGKLSGNVAGVPVGLPAQAFGNALTAIGTADAAGKNKADINAGGDTRTTGQDGQGSGNVLGAPINVIGQGFGNGLAAIGQADARGANHLNSNVGGNTKTNGANGQGSGNVVAAPAALAGQVFGNAGAVFGRGNAEGLNSTAQNTGGDIRTTGDDSQLGGNIVSAPAGLIGQAFGNGLAGGGDADAYGANCIEQHTGGEGVTGGAGSALGGNVLDAPIAAAGQVFGESGAGFGNANAAGDNAVEQLAGGGIFTNGQAGQLAGNVAQVPVALIGQEFGDAGSVFYGHANSVAGSNSVQHAGGSTTTNGTDGNLSGDFLGLPVAADGAGFGNAGGLFESAISRAVAGNNTWQAAGGDVNTAGENGHGAGDIFEIPVAAAGQFFGNGGAIGAIADATAANYQKTQAGGTGSTDGEHRVGSGFSEIHGLPLQGQVYGVPFEIAGEALASATNATQVTAGSQDAIPFVFDGAGLPGASDLPQMPEFVPSVSSIDVTKIGHDARTSLPGVSALQGVPALPGMPSVPGVPTGASLPNLPKPSVDQLGGIADKARAAAPSLPGASVPSLPGADKLPSLPKLPGADKLPSVPGVDQAPVFGRNTLHTMGRSASTPQLPSLDTAGDLSKVLQVKPNLPKLGANLPGLDKLGK
ncbi:DUF320 domain-containing protein [Pseudonocardiaceae bacterium YIM PH 21723]|nr:DUF320 domain-containing protein [Pseudonocardiaceae bacterium YIM PH 21723]